ncbi:putative phenylalanyl-tRNA synthetase alpha chain [Monocercomonoides exilis]|uniref:putative phenylalanyl-tRNA synthetase alpha chain n=1 Tax=Monocercomonoides exilis TaxID=2049356 RepID=UPI00355979DA|nr:putative phenylalanyl-tRNA synthetase alpha chain [Monocercomonoides exilis]|eukprot:MONOS_2635.1-p1 / transcript=MONOS_2635.1 / gene=MONOS_2635 / organism=Monocercomonoides_exilis_PA203 / gene_product=phenylalanyl-tRNA synthetase alpha chain / transcript_product=phenylalanyl-tRNA synthetase alpha chain / location=Mono_scaffold00055:122125-124322(+) / protein_length=581 / sequence_SO=supercontig / SO=protein_coding / is_pseudo=false
MTEAELEDNILKESRKAFQERIHKELLVSEQILDLAAFDAEFQAKSKDLQPALTSMASKGFITTQSTQQTFFKITELGNQILSGKETDDEVVYKYIGSEGKLEKEAKDHLKGPLIGVLNGLVKKGYLILDKSGEPIFKQDKPFVDELRDMIVAFDKSQKGQGAPLPQKEIDGLVKKKWVEKGARKVISVSKGLSFDSFTTEEQKVLTNDMLRNGEWAKGHLKEKKFTVANDVVPWGKLHPLVEMRSQFRRIFLKLGFSEMFTRRYVESSFWNFDALFQPQAHPCRDLQDTFFVASSDCKGDNTQCKQTECAEQEKCASSSCSSSSSSSSSSIPAPYAPYDLSSALPSVPVDRIRAAHESGGAVAGGSIGLNYRWSEWDAKKMIMRTHTTAISARTLASLNSELHRHWEKGEYLDLKAGAAAEGGIKESRLVKFFSVDRVFRNETLDKTHLAEFHQLEGFVVGRNLHVGDLIGTIKEFFAEIGMTQLKFQPTFNPYTEPSLEMYAFHPLLKAWIEIGNSGIFRDEVMRPLGLGEDVRAIAWGLSLERPAMIQANVSAIGDLFGSEVDVNWIEQSCLKMLHP